MKSLSRIGEELRKQALSYPGTDEHQPWGETAIKVKGKTFLFMRAENDAGHSRNLRAIEQDICGLATVTADRRDIGKRVESPSGRQASQTNFIETC